MSNIKCSNIHKSFGQNKIINNFNLEGKEDEFLVLVGTFQKNILVAVLASLGVILAAAYMLWLYRRVVFGKIASSEIKEMKDLNKSEMGVLISIGILVIFFGFYPEPLFNTVNVSVDNLINNYNMEISKLTVLK